LFASQEFITQHSPDPDQPRFNGSDGQTERLGNLDVTETLLNPQDQHDPVLLGQLFDSPQCSAVAILHR
jgi:hypothetical protein